ncbi:hypothetical protein Esti_000349 [Eimeria stiedai]
MAGVRTRRLLRLVDASRPFQPVSDGHIPLRNLELAYQDICYLAEASPMDLSPEIIFAFCLNACCHDELVKANHVFQAGCRKTTHTSIYIDLRLKPHSAFLDITQSRLAGTKGMALIEQHKVTITLIERACLTANQDHESIDPSEFSAHAIKVLLVILRPFMRAPWARHFSDGLEKVMPLMRLSRGPLVKSSEKGQKNLKVIASTTGQGFQGVKQPPDASDATELKLLASFLVHAAFCFEDGGKRAKARKAVEDATRLCSQLKSSYGDLPYWNKWTGILERKIATIRGRLGVEHDSSGPDLTRVEGSQWVVAVEVALNRLDGAAATSASSPKDHTTAATGETGGMELLKAWALLEPTLPQVVEAAFLENGTMPHVDDQVERLLQSVDFGKDFGENDHFAAYLLTKAALAQRLWLLARTMTSALSRWHTGSSGAVMLQGILEIETGLYLQEFLYDTQLKDSMSFTPSAPLGMLVPVNKELSPIPELRVKAIKRLEESLMGVEHLSVNGDLVEICVATMWNIARPCLCPAFRRQVFRSLHRARSALNRYQSIQLSLQVKLLHQLAQWEVEEENFGAAQTSIRKALETDCAWVPDATQKLDHASSILSRDSAAANPVLAASCALEADGSVVQAAERQAYSLYWCLELMREQNSAFTAENSTFVQQLQQLALRSKHEEFLANICEHAECLSSRALKQLEEEELRRDAPQQPMQVGNISKRSAQIARESVVREDTLSWKTENEVKKIIWSFSCLLKRALELEDFTAAARAATAVLSLIHGTEECLSAQNLSASPLVASNSVDLRVRLRPPLEAEVAVNIVHASYSLAVCKSVERAGVSCEKPQVVSDVLSVSREVQPAEQLLPSSKEENSGGFCTTDAKAGHEEESIRSLLLYGVRLSAAFGQTWLVFNGAIYTRNIYKHLVEGSSAKATEIQQLMPLLKETFQRLLEQPANTYESVLEAFTEFCCRAALAIQDFASIQEFCNRALPIWHPSSKRAMFGALLQDVVQRNMQQAVLSRLLKTGAGPTGDPGGSAEKFGKLRQLRGQTGTAPDNFSTEKLTPDILVLLQLEKAILEKEASAKGHLLLQCGDLLRSATSTIQSNGDTHADEPTGGLKIELWARLAAEALSLSSTAFQHLSVVYAFEALGSKHRAPPYKVTFRNSNRQHLWRGVAHVLAGLALVATNLTRSGRISAIRHLLQACTYGEEVGCVKLLLFAANALWKAAIPVLSDNLDADEACSAVKAALCTIPANCRSAAVGLITRMCMGLLWSFRKNSRWDQLLRMAEAAVLLIPKHLHGVLMKLQILALTCQKTTDLSQRVSAIVRGEPSNEAALLLFFARLSFDNSITALEPYEKALELFRAGGDPQAIFVHMELAERLLTMRRPWAKACTHIRAATELLSAWKKLPEFFFDSNLFEQRSSSQGEQDARTSSFAESTATPIKLQDLLLLHAQIFRLLYSPNSADTIDAAREVVLLSTRILHPCKAQSLETENEKQECQEATESIAYAVHIADRNERVPQDFESWAAASLCQPIFFKITRKSSTIAEAHKGAEFDQSHVGPSKDCGASSPVNAACPQEQGARLQHTLLWSTHLALVFRSLSIAESYFFDLGLEYWALRLVRLRAKIAEAFLSLSLSSGETESCIDGSGCIHPAIALLQASLNMQICRAALACQCLDEAKVLLPLFSPPILRNLINKLDKATKGGEGYFNALGRQARCLSVVTDQRISCLVPLTQLLLTLGEQCLLIGEVGLGSQLSQAAHRYMGSFSHFNNRTASLYVRHVALLASSRLRQGDQNGALQLVQRVLQSVLISSLDIQAAVHLVEIYWKAHASKGTVAQAMPLLRKVEQSLSELAVAASATCGFDRSTHKLTGLHAASYRRQTSTASITSRREKASKAANLSVGVHESRAGRGAASLDSIQWPLMLAVWRHHLKKLQVEHLFSLHCLGWTTEGGALQNDWKKIFLDAMVSISSLLDRSDDVRVILKPLRACAVTCLRGVRFLTAAMQFLWAYPKNFLEYRWESPKSPYSVQDECRKAPLVTPSDLKECIERLQRVLAGLDLESKSILNFISNVEGSPPPYQSASLWADMIAIASAQVACLNHQLLLTTTEFRRAEIQEALDGTLNGIVGTGTYTESRNLKPGRNAREEERRFLQRWLYKSHNEDDCLSENMQCESQRLEYAAKELASVRIPSGCRQPEPKGFDIRSLQGKSSLEAQWSCQFILLQQYQQSLQGRKRLHDQGRGLSEVSAQYCLAEKSGKGLQRSVNQLTYAGMRDPAGSLNSNITSHELESAFLSCIASGSLHEATVLGDVLISEVLGNKHPENFERLFAAITILQAAKVAQTAKLLQLQYMEAQMAECVAVQELRNLEDSHQHARILPQFQTLKTLLESYSCFSSMTNISDPSPSAIVQIWLPRNICVACVHCSRGFVFLALACSVPTSEGGGAMSSFRYFVERRALPACLLLDIHATYEDCYVGNTTNKEKTAAAALYAFPRQVHEVLEDLFEAIALQMLQWSLEGMLLQSQASASNETSRQLLLLPDIKLSHFPFEELTAVKRIFGFRITRDFSLHMFARRMQHNDASFSPQPKRTVADMHTGFNRGALLLFPVASKNLGTSSSTGHGCLYREDIFKRMMSSIKTEGTSADLQAPGRVSPITPTSPREHDWRSAVFAELSASKKTGFAEGAPELHSSCSPNSELLCSKSPQVAWAMSLEKLMPNCDDLKASFASMDLTHLSLIGLLSMRKDIKGSGSPESQRLKSVCYRRQKLVMPSEGVEMLLLLSTRGVGGIVAVDEYVTEKQKTDLAARFLRQLVGLQVSLCCAV